MIFNINYKKIIVMIFLCFFTGILQFCNGPGPVIKENFREFLTSETWYADLVIQCENDTVTNSYLGFSIKFNEPANQNDSIIQIDFFTTNGFPAFDDIGYLLIDAGEIDDNNFSSERDDSVIVTFINVNSNIEQEILEFIVEDIVECDSTMVIQKYQKGELRLADIAFRNRRR